MRTASWLFVAALLLGGCGGDAPKDTTSAQEPIVEKSAPATGSSATAAADGTRLTVVFTNNVDGEIEPCG